MNLYNFYFFQNYFSGEENDCSAEEFILKPEVQPEEPMIVDQTEEDSGSGVEENQIDETVEPPVPTTDDLPDEEVSYDELQVISAIERREKVSGTRPAEVDLDTVELTDHPYEDSWEDMIEKYLTQVLDKGTFSSNKQWIELLVDPDHPFNSRVRSVN